MKALCLALFLATAAASQVKEPEAPAIKPAFENSLQVVVLTTGEWDSTQGRGSCIFLHIWQSPGDATSGCTAMSCEDLERVIAWLDPKNNPYLIQTPESVYKHYEKTWKLPKI